MKVYVSFDGDHIGRMIGRAKLADQPEEAAKISQRIDRGNKIWESWALAHGGVIITLGGDEGTFSIDPDALTELPKIREQYQEAVDSTVSVGVGVKLSEADRALMAAKMQGGDRIQLFTEEVNEILAELQDKDEGSKLYDEYLNPDSGLKKAGPGMNPGAHAGFSGPSQSHPAAPIAPTEGSEHSEAEVARSIVENAPQGPQQAAQDYEQLFHELAAAQPKEEPQAPTGLVDPVRAQIVKILQDVRGHAQELEQMRSSNPELYTSIQGVVEAMIAMARNTGQEVQKSEDLEKAIPKQFEQTFRPGKPPTTSTAKDFSRLSDDQKVFTDQLMEQGFQPEKPPALLPSAKKTKGFVPNGAWLGPAGDTDTWGPEVTSSKAPDAYADIGGADAGARADLANRVNPDAVHQSSVDSSQSFFGDKWSHVRNAALQSAAPIPSIPDPNEDEQSGRHMNFEWGGTAQQPMIHAVSNGEWQATLTLGADGQPQVHSRSEWLTGGRLQSVVDHVTNHLKTSNTWKTELEKGALEAGKTGRHNVVLPVGAQIDAGPEANHEAGEIKIRDPETQKTKWRSVRAGLVMAPDGTPTSSRNPSGGK